MTRKIPTEAEATGRIKNDIERTLSLTDTLNGRKALGGQLGKQFKLKAINTTADFDQFLKDTDYLIKNFTNGSAEISIQRLRTSIASLRDKGGKKK
ncbi:hypothetical protein NIES4101_46240 [Calothrix sp. NIES-4101]|nr:hypothetical protein NIES4101_46240 [Calothrix sp. NIES-4101]